MKKFAILHYPAEQESDLAEDRNNTRVLVDDVDMDTALQKFKDENPDRRVFSIDDVDAAGNYEFN